MLIEFFRFFECVDCYAILQISTVFLSYFQNALEVVEQILLTHRETVLTPIQSKGGWASDTLPAPPLDFKL